MSTAGWRADMRHDRRRRSMAGHAIDAQRHARAADQKADRQRAVEILAERLHAKTFQFYGQPRGVGGPMADARVPRDAKNGATGPNPSRTCAQPGGAGALRLPSGDWPAP
eukprot:gene15033-15173_t